MPKNSFSLIMVEIRKRIWYYILRFVERNRINPAVSEKRSNGK